MILFKNSKLLTISYFVVLAIVIMIPMLRQNDIITTIKDGSDMQAHLGVAQSISNGEKIYPIYLGQAILGYMLSPFGHYEHLDGLYLWLSFAILMGVVISVFYVVRKLFGDMSAYLVAPMMLFCSSGIISLFRYGVIFALINMFIILPFAVYYFVRYFTDGKLKYGIISILLFILFSVFHSSGIYLIACAVIGFILLVVRYILDSINGTIEQTYKKMFIPLIMFLVIVLAGIFLPKLIFGDSLSSLLSSTNILASDKYYIGIDPSYDITMFVRHISVTVAFILMIMLVIFFKEKYYKLLDKKQVYFFGILGGFVIVILGVIVIRFTHDTLFINRLMVDATTLLTILTSCLTGFILKQYKNKVLNWATSIIVIGGSIPLLKMWIG